MHVKRFPNQPDAPKGTNSMLLATQFMYDLMITMVVMMKLTPLRFVQLEEKNMADTTGSKHM